MTSASRTRILSMALSACSLAEGCGSMVLWLLLMASAWDCRPAASRVGCPLRRSDARSSTPSASTSWRRQLAQRSTTTASQHRFVF